MVSLDVLLFVHILANSSYLSQKVIKISFDFLKGVLFKSAELIKMLGFQKGWHSGDVTTFWGGLKGS